MQSDHVGVRPLCRMRRVAHRVSMHIDFALRPTSPRYDVYKQYCPVSNIVYCVIKSLNIYIQPFTCCKTYQIIPGIIDQDSAWQYMNYVSY